MIAVLLALVAVLPGAVRATTVDEIGVFKEYLKLRTDHPYPRYHEASEWIQNACKEAGMSVQTLEPVKDKPIVICSVLGTDPSLPSILFNSHVDVVPAGDLSLWQSDPFEAVESNGSIAARGAQDMKCVGIQYLLAVRRLLQSGWKPTRSVHVSWVPDEEIGGLDGARELVESEEFAKLNVGFGMDEGLPLAGEDFGVYYAERASVHVKVLVKGSRAHSATLPTKTAPMRILEVIAKAMGRRDHLGLRSEPPSGGGLGSGEGLAVGVNLMYVKTGVVSPTSPTGFVMNIIPDVAEAGIDMRVPPHVSRADLEAEVQSWGQCDEECLDTSVEIIFESDAKTATSHDLVYSKTVMETLRDLGLSARYFVFAGGTDARYLRSKGIPALGFSPMNGTIQQLHQANESLDTDLFVKGIATYEKLISALGALPDLAKDEL